MAANTPIDSGITAQTLAFYNQMWALWQAGKHISAAWVSINQLALENTSQPEWNLFKLTTGQAPAMVCFNGGVVWVENGAPVNVFGAPNPTLANTWDGVLPLLEAVTLHGGAAQALPAARCPGLYTAGSTYSGSATTVGALTTTLPVTSTAAFSSGGGSGVIVASDGVHPFTYSGLSGSALVLTGGGVTSQAASNSNANVTQSSSATVAVSAPVYPASLQTGNAGVLPTAGLVNGSSYVTEAWPLHWSSTAYTTLAAAQPTGGGIAGATVNGWADAQACNANGNLNAMLDGIAVLAAALSPYPLILRPMAESNNGSTSAFWYDQGNFAWGPQLFRYIVGYLTGNAGFAGQPVTTTPVHNILFATNSSSSGTETIGTDFPKAAAVGFVADIVSIDIYSATWAGTNPKASFTTAHAVTGYSNVVPILMEAYGNTAAHYDPYATVATTGDLHGITSFVTQASYDSARAFAASGSLQVMTSNGVQEISYSSFTTTGANPNKVATFVISSTAGVPVGSIINQGPSILDVFLNGACVGSPASVSPSTSNTNFLLGIKDATTVGGCHFCVNPLSYGGNGEENSMLFQPGFAAVMQDADTVNLPTPGNWSTFEWGQGQGTEWNWQSPLIGTA